MTDETVMRAILAMDTYHRGSAIGIELDDDTAARALGRRTHFRMARTMQEAGKKTSKPPSHQPKPGYSSLTSECSPEGWQDLELTPNFLS